MGLNPTTPQGLPAQFNDKLSLRLLLQPDAQYLFARMLFAAKARQEAAAVDLNALELAQVMASEGRMPSISGSAANLAEAMSNDGGGPLDLTNAVAFPEMVSMVAEAKLPGEVIKINRPKFINGDTTWANRLGSTGSKLFGVNSQPLGMEQVQVEIVETLGPLDASGLKSPISVPAFMLDRAENDLLAMIGPQLRRDRMRFLDDKFMTDVISAAVGLGNVTRPTGIASDAAFTSNEQEPLDFETITRAEQVVNDRNIPGIGGEPDRLMFVTPTGLRQLKNDPKFERLAVFFQTMNPLFPGAIGRIGSLIIYQSTRLPTIANQGVGSNVTLYQAIVLSPGAYGWGVARDIKALRNSNDDGGRDNEFGWSAYEGLQVLDPRFFQVIHHD